MAVLRHVQRPPRPRLANTVAAKWLTLDFVEQLFRDRYLGNPDRKRLHTDDSVEWKYSSKAALSVTADAGCETGGGVRCSSQYFLGVMLYNRVWFNADRYAVTLGGGGINNPGRYLVLLPPINGATASSGTPYFTTNPGDPFRAWDASLTFDYMPSENVTFRWEFDHRHSNVPYFAGRGGMTPSGGNSGSPGSIVDGFTPDLRRRENRINIAMLIKL